MNEYVIQNSELEGHFEHFQDSKRLCDNLKKCRLTVILRQLDYKLCELNEKYAKKADKAMLIHMEWTRYLTGAVSCVVTDNDDPAIVIDPAVQVQLLCHITDNREIYIYIHKSKEIKNTVPAVKLDVTLVYCYLGADVLGRCFASTKRNDVNICHC